MNQRATDLRAIDAYREVALKIPNPGRMTMRRFAFELHILRELAGTKGVTPLIASQTVDEGNGGAWLAMPIARGILPLTSAASRSPWRKQRDDDRDR